MSDARGLMAFWADIDPDYVTEYRRWHNCEHVSERVNIPGFVNGRRYCGSGEAAMFLMYYETETPEVLASEAYHAALNAPTPWTKQALTHFRNPARNIYQLVASEGAALAEPAPYVATIRFNLSAEEEAIVAAYGGSVLPALAAEAGVLRARLYRIDEKISGIVTSERKIYGGGPGEQRYLLFVELAEERPAIAPGALPGLPEGAAGRHADVFAEAGWLDFSLDAPKR